MRPLARVTLWFTLAALICPRAAWCQFNPRSPLTGVEIAGALGYGTFTSNAAFHHPNDSTPGVLSGSYGAHVSLAYRIVPAASIGARFLYQNLASSSASAGGSAGGDAEALGAYLRVHLLALIPERRLSPASMQVDLYFGLGVDFLARVNNWASGSGVSAGTAASGFAIPFTLGIDYMLSDFLGIGAIAQVSEWMAGNYCSTVNGASAGCDTLGRGPEQYYFIGIGLIGRLRVLR